MAHIILIGFMGSGKTTVGKLLAEQLGLPFVDSDRVIEEQSNKNISELFDQEGETSFRLKEHLFCEQLESMTPSVIATGGGLPCFEDNLALLKANGKVIYLNTSLQTLTQRLKSERSKRPLLKHLEDPEVFAYIEEKITDRKVFYKQAHVIVPNESNQPKSVVEKILKLLVD